MDRYSDDRLSAVADTDVGTGRNQTRDSLLLSARFRELGKNREDQVRVRNLSAGGLMVELPRDAPVDTAVECERRGTGWVRGPTVWNHAGRRGGACENTN